MAAMSMLNIEVTIYPKNIKKEEPMVSMLYDDLLLWFLISEGRKWRILQFLLTHAFNFIVLIHM